MVAGFQRDRTQPADSVTVFDAGVFGVGRRHIARRFDVRHAVLDAGEVAVLRRIRDAGSDRIQIDIHHAGRNGFLAVEHLGFETAFPETARTFGFGVALASDHFTRATVGRGSCSALVATPFISDFFCFPSLFSSCEFQANSQADRQYKKIQDHTAQNHSIYQDAIVFTSRRLFELKHNGAQFPDG